MVVLTPAAVVMLVFFMAANAPFSTIRRGGTGKEWAGFSQLVCLLWAALMMPLDISLETALVAGIDHADNQWKSLLARPVPRWTWYIAKLIVIVAMLAVSTVVLFCGILVAGITLPHIQGELAFKFPIPWGAILIPGTQVAGLAFLSITIQHWVSLRWRSFSVAIGVGIVGMVVGYVAAIATLRTPDWPQYFPWALPMLVLSRHPQNTESVLWVSGAIGLIVAMVGCLEFCKREIS
jgi:hypothetical protein